MAAGCWRHGQVTKSSSGGQEDSLALTRLCLALLPGECQAGPALVSPQVENPITNSGQGRQWGGEPDSLPAPVMSVLQAGGSWDPRSLGREEMSFVCCRE